MSKTPLLGKSLSELTVITENLKLPRFTAKQISEWLYKKRIISIDEMTNISLNNRELLKEEHEIGRSNPVAVSVSEDGTKKYLFNTSNNHFIETVYIPEDDRSTLCVSSQVGCKMNCLFCMTGKQGFDGQLSDYEILNQIFSIPEADKLTNLVFMGMGEPFDNTLSLLRSLEVMTADYGCGWSPHRITVSTVGLIPGMKVFLEKTQCHLAISLHSPFENERLGLIPSEKPYPASKVISELRKYDFSKQRRLSFEYILFDGLNDTTRHAVALAKMLRNINCRVNLIHYHAIPSIDLKSSNTDKLIFFRNYLNENGIVATIRRSRGEDILAACGMLSTSEKEKQKE